MDTFALANIRTARQSQAIHFWIEGGRKSKAEALRRAGYSEAVARHPERVFGSKSVQKELELRGLGRDGFGNHHQPKSEVLEADPPDPYAFDPTSLTREQLQELKEKLRTVGYKPALTDVMSEQIDSSSMTPYPSLGKPEAQRSSGRGSFPSLSSM